MSSPIPGADRPAAPPRQSIAIATVVSTSTTGTPSAIQEKNGRATPASRRTKPTPIRFGGVPTGVPSPPIDAANDAERRSAVPYAASRARPACCSSTARSESPIGYIIATVAVLLIHIEIAHVAVA